MKKVVLNPDYFLRHDIKRTFIINKYQNHSSSYGWYSIIHPIHAMVFTFFSYNKNFDEVISDISNFIGLPPVEVVELITPFIENKEDVYVTFESTNFNIPKNVLINSEDDVNYEYKYAPEDFICDECDFITKRYLDAPLNITFMPNNLCVTNCIYCYADKSHVVKRPLEFERVKEIIDEAKNLKVLSFSVVGGEVFTYKYWKELLKYIKENNFEITRISSKVPITIEDILYLKSIGITQIQMSIDSFIDDEMKQMLSVNSEYIKKIKQTLTILSDEKFDIQIATILTKHNTSKKSIDSVFNFIKNLNVSNWNISPGFESLYKPKQSFRADKESIYRLFDYLEDLKKKSQFTISADKTFIERDYGKFKDGSENFTGATCSSLCSHIFILPDGKVTMCEQLYWNPHYIIGDLTDQSIRDVWNSERVKWFLNIKPQMLKPSNPCSTCEIFENCYNNMNRCWSEVLKAYGQSNWDFPDPRCSLAPEMINDLNF